MLNRIIAYTSSWKDTAKIAGIIGLLVIGVLIFLQPFDTYNHHTSYKNLKLSGYFLPVSFSILLTHLIEGYWYRNTQKQWKLWQEIVAMLLLMLILTAGTYLYLMLVINQSRPSIGNYATYTIYFALPFGVIILPLIIYLRSQFGEIVMELEEESIAHKSPALIIRGDNKEEELALSPDDFLFAKSMQNYVDIFYLDSNGEQAHTTLRLTLRKLLEQMPQSWQVHRSYLINLAYVEKVQGNARKREVLLTGVNEPIPISQKYYEGIKQHLSNSSQNLINSPKKA